MFGDILVAYQDTSTCDYMTCMQFSGFISKVMLSQHFYFFNKKNGF